MGGRSDALDVDQVLNGKRNAVQRRKTETRRTSSIRAPRTSKCALARQGDERVEMLVRLLYSLEEPGHIIDRTESAAYQGGARRNRAEIRVIATAGDAA